MSGRHRRRTSKIRAATKGMILFAVALFLIFGALWIYLDSA